MSQSAPVLLTVFNRPEQTALTVQALLREKPSRIYISGDGPRAHVATDVEQVSKVWEIVDSAPWQCEVIPHRTDQNLGCATSVRAALDWFFASEPCGCVLEDDVELGPGALALAQRLLMAGEHRADIGSISLLNTVPRSHLSEPHASYRQSRFASSWGWGTWATTWQQSPRSSVDWRSWLPVERLRELGGPAFASRWAAIFDSDTEGVNSQIWDYTWQAYLWTAAPISLVSNVNLVRNNGFSDQATYSGLQRPAWVPETLDSWTPPFMPPAGTGIDERADAWESRHRYGISRSASLRRSLATRLPHVTDRYRRLRYRSNE